jgi:hypothetical protein
VVRPGDALDLNGATVMQQHLLSPSGDISSAATNQWRKQYEARDGQPEGMSAQALYFEAFRSLLIGVRVVVTLQHIHFVWPNA